MPRGPVERDGDEYVEDGPRRKTLGGVYVLGVELVKRDSHWI